jgi:CTP:phosphocholine cytidylyltransferase-like protein
MENLHTVKQAIIMAAGIGKRMQPLTFEIPKPLVIVNGARMIDTVVSALQANGVNEIYVVVGYLKEQFYEWAKGKGNIHIIENPYYESCNNISSLYVARDHLENCVILDGDQIIYNQSILDPNFSLSGYNAVWCEEHTDEWLMNVENGIVKSCSRCGGSKGWQLYSISRWTADDGAKLRHHLELEFESGNKDLFWDDVAMFCHFADYKLGIREMKKEDIIEIDNLEELIQMDSSYEKYNESRVTDYKVFGGDCQNE